MLLSLICHASLEFSGSIRRGSCVNLRALIVTDEMGAPPTGGGVRIRDLGLAGEGCVSCALHSPCK